LIHQQVKNLILNKTITNLTNSIESTQIRINNTLMIPLELINDLNNLSKAPILQEWSDSVDRLRIIFNENPQLNDNVKLFDSSKFNANINALSSITDSSQVKFKEIVDMLKILKGNFNNNLEALEDGKIIFEKF
jgi:hypothetical protein